MKGNRKWWRRVGKTMAVGILVLLLAWFALPFALPLPAGLTGPPPRSPVWLDRQGRPLLHAVLADDTRATPLPLAQMPPDLIACTLAAEDKRFHQHGGVDLLATARALRDGIAHRRVISGASTLTQQLVKISSPPARRTIPTKIREALTARRLEMSWSKSRILEAYLNRLDYGNLRIGPAEAARFYFEKPLADLSLAESALLAGLPQAPSRLNPLRHPQRALARRDTVLRRLAANGSVPSSRIEAALREPLSLRTPAPRPSAPWLANLPAGSGEIRTTLDGPLQRDLETIVREETARLKEANLRHAAVIAIDNPTGEILGWVSSADWDDPHGGQINGALTPRSPGSTLKPFTYLLAMRSNHRTPVSLLADIPSPFRTPQGLDLPENYDRTYRGPVTLRTALACSLNLPALRELNELGGPRPLFDFLRELGFTTLGPDPGVHGLGLTLGNAPVPLLELTSAYATLARQGSHRPAALFPSTPGPAHSIFDARSAWLIADILSDPAARAPAFPPGGPLDLPFRCAVKTGTSSDFHDNWCVGFTPRFTVGVWAGNFEHRPMKGLSGIAGAGPIFHRAMLRLHQDIPATWYPRPAEITEVRIDPRNGKLALPDLAQARPDLVPSEEIPSPATTADYDADARARVGPEFAGWYASRHNQRLGELAPPSSASAGEPLRILSPVDNALFLLDPEIPSGSDKLRPVTNLPGLARWHSDTLRIEPGEPEPVIHLTVGTHTVTATVPATGEVRTLTLRVRAL